MHFMLDRYHTNQYIYKEEQRLAKFQERREMLIQTLSKDVISWVDYKVDMEVKTLNQENQSLYYTFYYKKTPSLKWCSAVQKEDSNLELDLPKVQLRFTLKCYKKARHFIARLSDFYRRRSKVVHVKNVQDSINMIFNQQGAALIINEIRDIQKMCSETDFDDLFRNGKLQIMKVFKITCRITWTLPEIQEIISGKNTRNKGFYIISILKEGLIQILKDLILWTIRATKKMDALEGDNYILISQDIWEARKFCFNIIKTLLDGAFMGFGNLQSYLVPFKTDLSQEILGQRAVEIEQSACAQRLRNALFEHLYLPCCQTFFQDHDTEILSFAKEYQRDISPLLCQIYSQLCGYFKQELKSYGITDLIVAPKIGEQQGSTEIKQSPKLNDVEVLKDMGFSTEHAEQALQLSNNSFDAALELLLNKKSLFEGESSNINKLSDFELESHHKKYEEYQQEHKLQIEKMLNIIQSSFGKVHEFFSYCPLNQQQQSVINLFRVLKLDRKLEKDGKENMANTVLQQVMSLFERILMQEIQVPYWVEVEFTIQLLTHINNSSKHTIAGHLKRLSTKMQLITKQVAVLCQTPIAKELTQKDIPDNEELIIANDKINIQNRERHYNDMQVLYDINAYLKLASVVCNYISFWQEARVIDTLVKTDQPDQTDGLTKEQLEQIVTIQEDDKKKKSQLHEKWQQIVTQIKPLNDREQIDTSHQIALALLKNDKEVGQVLSHIFASIETLLKSFASIHFTVNTEQQDGITSCLQRGLHILKTLGDIQYIGSFDFKKAFINADLLKAIFDIKVTDDAWDCPLNRLVSQEKIQLTIVREMLEGFWLQSKDLQRVYETLIKRQMFYQFKQTFKREENKELLDSLKTIIVTEQITSPQIPNQNVEQIQFSAKKNRTKNKDTTKTEEKVISRGMRSKSEEKKFPKIKATNQTSKVKEVWPLTPDQCSTKQLKKFMKRTEAYNKQKFTDFLMYFDSGAFGLNIKRVDLFIAAVAKLCVIKTEIENKEGKTTSETRIMLKRSVLREIIVDPDFHSIVAPLPTIQLQNRVQFEQELNAWRLVSNYGNPEHSFTTKLQQDMVSQLLDCLVQQTRGYTLDLIKLFRDPSIANTVSEEKYQINDTVISVENLTTGKRAGKKSLLVDKQSTSVRKEYYFDIFAIMNIFVSMLALNIPIAEVILRHNDRKTIKFLARNMFLLFSLKITNREITFESSNMWFAQKLTVMCNFLNHLMISNFGTRNTDIVVREEIQRIFITQLAKQLNQVRELYKQGSFWASDARLVNTFGPVWLLTNFLMNKFSNEDENAKDVQTVILQKKFKHMRLQRFQMIKLLILECQLQAKKTNQVGQIALLEDIQKISHHIVNDCQFFLSPSKSRFYQQCILAVSNVIKLFDSSMFQQHLSQRNKQIKMASQIYPDWFEPMEGTNEILDQMLEQGDFLIEEEGEDEFEEMEDEESSEDSQEQSQSDQNSGSDDNGSEYGLIDLSSHRSNSSNVSFDNQNVMSYDSRRPLGEEDLSEYDEDYTSSENSWEQGTLIEIPGVAQEPEVIVTTKRENISPRNRSEYSDYGEEDSSSNFQIGNNQAPSEDAEDEQENDNSDSYGSMDPVEQNEADDMYNTFNSFSDNEASRNILRDEDDFDEQDSEDRSISQSQSQSFQPARRLEQAAIFMRNNGERLQNPFAEAPLNIEVSMPQGMAIGQRESNQIERILESTIGAEVEMRQLDYYGEFGWHTTTVRTKLLEFRRTLRATTAPYRLFMTHYYAFTPVEKPSLEEAKHREPVSTFEQIETSNHMPKKTGVNALEIEGMDPLFMENLTSVGLQNIADSHHIHNQISSQARGGLQNRTDQNPVDILSNFITFLGSQTPQRRLELLNSIQSQINSDLSPEMIAAARNLYQANGADFARLMNEVQDRFRSGMLNVNTTDLQGLVNFQENQQARQLRPRMISMSSVSYDVRGVDDTVERIQDNQSPQVQQRIGNRGQLNSQQAIKFIEVGGRNKIQLKGTQYMQNFYQMLQDHIVKYESDAQNSGVDTQCEQVLSLNLVPIESDGPDQIYHKLQGLINMGITVLRNQREMELDNPQFGETLVSSMVMIDKIPHLRSCITLQVLSILNQEVKSMAAHCSEMLINGKMMPYFSQLTTYDQSTAGLRQLNINEVVSYCLNCIFQMQEIAGKSFTQKVQKKREIILNLSGQPTLHELARIIGGINTDRSILEELLDSIQSFFDQINENSWLLESKDNVEEDQYFQKDLFQFLIKIFKSVQGSFKINDARLIPVSQICRLFLSLLNSQKPNKQMIMIIRKAFNVCCFDKDSCRQVGQHIQALVDLQLKNTVDALNSWNNFDQSYKTTLTPHIDQITQLLSISGGMSKSLEVEICSESLLLEVFLTSNQILQQEQQQNQNSIKIQKFMQRQDVRDLIKLLFALSEYSLKKVYNQTPHETEETKEQGDDDNIVSTFQVQQATQQIELDEIDTLLKPHINKSSHQFAKFKTIASFFIKNKKLLNQFIKVNQQLISTELKNLVLFLPQILDFDTKRLIWRAEIKKHHSKNRKRVIRITVHRDRAFDDSFAHLQQLKAEEWKSLFEIQFVDEDGVDQGGLTKEWFMLLSKQMFDENLALFIKADNGSTYFPNPRSTVQGNFVQLFNFVGRVIGKALWEQQLLDCYFVKAFYKMMLEMPLDLHDLEDYDQSLYKSLMWILQNENVEQLSSYFVETMDYFGTQKEVELVPDGHNKLVNDQNKHEYVRLMANFKLDRAISEQKQAFLTGFYSIIPKDLLKMFDNRELELLISGLQNIDVDDLRENTIYEGYNARSRPVILLWEVLQELDNSERAEFIQFVTGSSKVPVEGFKGLRGPNGQQKFTIARIQTHGELRLPQSHTCMNTLDLPEYKDKDTLKRMLLIAIREGKNFGIA